MNKSKLETAGLTEATLSETIIGNNGTKKLLCISHQR
jgi:hypothetical protein